MPADPGVATRRLWTHPLLLAHAICVAALLVALPLLLNLPDVPAGTPNANIGGGLIELALLVLGLPWSTTFFTVNVPGVQVGIVVVSAVANVIIHLAVRATLNRDARQAAESAASDWPYSGSHGPV